MDGRKDILGVWILPAALVVAGLIWVHWQTLKSMYDQWMANDDFSHGVLIVPIVLYLIWKRRKTLVELPPRPDWRGLVAMIGAVCLYSVGELGAELFTTRAAIICFCIGALWWLYGYRMLREAAFPLMLLFLMLPLPGFIYRNLTFSLQIFSSAASVELLNAIGFLACREGNVIDMGFGQFQVVDACNGLRFIMPLLTLGVLFAFFRPQAWWKRVLLVAVTIPLAMLTNILRIVGTGVLSQYFGPRVAQGFFHDFSGWAVFMTSFALFALFAWMLKRLPAKSAVVRSNPPIEPVTGSHRLKKQMAAATVVALALCLVSPMTVKVLGNVAPVPLKKSLDRFPRMLDGRTGVAGKIDTAVWEKVGGQNYVLINYSKAGEMPINFYTAYYEYQRKAGDFIHSPKLCLPGGGWYIASNNIRQLECPKRDRTLKKLRFNEILIEKNGMRQLVYFWYQGRDRNFTNEYAAKFYMVWDGIWRRRTDGALVRLVIPMAAGQSLDEARGALDRFALLAFEELDNFLP